MKESVSLVIADGELVNGDVEGAVKGNALSEALDVGRQGLESMNTAGLSDQSASEQCEVPDVGTHIPEDIPGLE